MTQPAPDGSGTTVWTRFVAIGDSFTEGMCDDDPTFGHDGEFAGWADRLASHLSEIARGAGFRLRLRQPRRAWPQARRRRRAAARGRPRRSSPTS